MTIARTLNVSLNDRGYPIYIGSDLLGTSSSGLEGIASSGKVLIVSNETVAPLYLSRAMALFSGQDVHSVVLPDGEKWKTQQTVNRIIDAALEAGLSRDSLFVALGGGVVGDMTGFAAATFMRGISFVQIPTTLLAQVDSSVGGKTGVNHRMGKNLIGAFHQPASVLIDIKTLDTLAAREFSAGMAEVIKYGAIMDLAFFDWLESNIEALMRRDPEALVYAVHRSCALKAQIVAEDEREQGRRALLNFGHTFGHAIEACTGYTRWLHGEAVAIGMLMAARMSALASHDVSRLQALLEAANLPCAVQGIPVPDLLAAMSRDKKVAKGRVRLILLRNLGDAYVTSDYDDARLSRILEG